MNARTNRTGWCSLGLLCAQLTFAWGCAGRPYRYGEFSKSGAGSQPDNVSTQVNFKYGQPHKTLDRMSDAVSWPRRKLRPDEPDKRKITGETSEKLRRYLEKNDLGDVHVAVRDYDPAEQWRRLRENRIVPPVSRYTIGLLSVTNYSLLPGRVFGRNAYNPYTNTLYVNSDAPALLLHQAAFAKNVRARPLPGVYAATSHVPFLAVWHDIDGARDLVGYAKAEEDWDLESESYRDVFPRVGSQATGGVAAFVPVWWGGPVLGVAGSVVGGVAGRTTLASRERQRDREVDQIVESEVLGAVQQASHEEPAKEPSRRRYVTPAKFAE
jgi:hypothetical protein